MGNTAWLPERHSAKILSGALDETNKRGTRTRLLRFAPGVFTTTPFVHDYWEEVYLVSGDLTVGNDATGNGVNLFRPILTHADRPALIMAHSNRTAAVRCLKFIISIRSEPHQRGAQDHRTGSAKPG